MEREKSLKMGCTHAQQFLFCFIFFFSEEIEKPVLAQRLQVTKVRNFGWRAVSAFSSIFF
jgi:hypothetical protein